MLGAHHLPDRGCPMSKRRTPLVCQFVENLSSEALEVYASVTRTVVGGRHGD